MSGPSDLFDVALDLKGCVVGDAVEIGIRVEQDSPVADGSLGDNDIGPGTRQPLTPQLPVEPRCPVPVLICDGENVKPTQVALQPLPLGLVTRAPQQLVDNRSTRRRLTSGKEIVQPLADRENRRPPQTANPSGAIDQIQVASLRDASPSALRPT